ncbi:PAS domain-containing protein [Marinobacter sp.]|uniref:PAS domain-containing protein n=1 Tax=Marinobacter sp. TaxID=50741 RepID=UPI00384F413D
MDNPKPARHRLLLWLPVPVLAAGLILTWLMAVQVQQHSEKLRSHTVAEQHQSALALLRQEKDNLVLAGKLIARPAPPDEEAFREQSRTLLTGHPGLLAVEYLETVPHSLRLLRERELSGDLGRPVPFSRWQSGGGSGPVEEAEQYLIVRWTEARPDGPARPGLVADTVPHWQSALLSALNQRVVTATARIDITRNNGHSSSVQLFIPGVDGDLLGLALAPAQWLAEVLQPARSAAVDLKVHDLSQHNSAPLVHFDTEAGLEHQHALRSELLFGTRQWMMTTTPGSGFLVEPAGQAKQIVWLGGLLLTGIAGGATGFLSRSLRREWHLNRTFEEEQQRLSRQLDNNQVEKSILKQALNNSEQRSRDLVALTGGFVCELDDRHRIVYMSPQIIDLLGCPAADYAEMPFHALVCETNRDNFFAALADARRERRMTRIDLHLIGAENEPLPFTLRVAAVTDPLSGCTGFRMTGQLREA